MGPNHRRRHLPETLSPAERTESKIPAWLLLAIAAALLARPAIHVETAEAAEVQSEEVTFQRRDGRLITALLFRPDRSGRHPAVLIFHGVGGMRESQRSYARRLAEAGFVTLLPELISIGVGADEPAGILRNEISAAMALLKGRKDVDPNRLGLLGFAQGGERALFAAISFPATFKAVVEYYGPIGRPPMNLELAAAYTASRLRSPVLILHGEDDQVIPVEHARRLEEALRSAGKPFEIILFQGTAHGFDQEGQPWYSPVAAREAEASTVAFFSKHLKAP
jgi:carboxymethylenebutenolidase